MILNEVPTRKGSRLDVYDSNIGEQLQLMAYFRGNKLVLQEVPKQAFRPGKTPRQLEQMATFGLAAWKGFDEKMTGELPPAAVHVQATAGTSGKVAKNRPIRPPPFTQTYYRSLIGEEDFRDLEIRIQNRLQRLGEARTDRSGSR